jgi:hypothetical protein
MSDWVDVGTGDDEWEDVGSSLGQRDLKGPIAQTAKNAFGGIDSALTMAAQAVPYIGSGLAGLGTLIGTGGNIDAATDVMSQLQESGLGLGKPEHLTKEGEQVTEMLGKGIEWAGEKIGSEWETIGEKYNTTDNKLAPFMRTLGEAGFEAASNFAPIPGGKGVRKLGKAIEKRYERPAPPTSDIKKSFETEAEATKPNINEDLARLGDANVMQKLQEADRKATFNEDLAAAHDASIMNRLKSIDEAIGAPDMSTTDRLIMSRLQELDRQMKKKEAEGTSAVADETLYTDPQGQTFRGDPAQPDPRLALERQTEAMDREMTWLKDTPEGDPLRPLRDVERENAMQEARDLRIAEMEADLKKLEKATKAISSKGKRGRQRGAIDVKAIKEGLLKGMHFMDPGGFLETWRGAFNSNEFEHLKTIVDSGSDKVQVSFLSPREFHTVAHLRGPAELADAPRLRGKIKKALYDKNGLYEAPELYVTVKNGVAKVTHHEGRHRMDVFRDEGLDVAPVKIHIRETDGSKPHTLQAQWTDNQAAQTVFPERVTSLSKESKQFADDLGKAFSASIPKKQRGAIHPDLMTFGVTAMVDKYKKRQKLSENLGLDEWDNIHDPDLAIALSKDAKDIAPDFGQKQLVSGMNMEVALSNNPLLKFARTVLRDSRVKADAFSRTFITAKDTGLTPLWSKMDDPQRIRVMEALMEADKHQKEITPAMMDSWGFTPAQRQFVKTFRDADESLLKLQHESADSLGMKKTERRVGHFPGIFTGAYKSVVTRPKANGKGMEVVAVLASDTVAQQKLAKQYIMEQYPDARMVDMDRPSLGGQKNNRYYSDLFTGWNDVLRLLGRHDDRFAEVNAVVEKALKDANNALFNFNVHELAKRGVTGNEGNRPWLDKKQNANDAFKALVRYFEEGALHHSLQKPLKDIDKVLKAEETQHMPNAQKYLNKYLDKVHGNDLNDLGRAMNLVIDAAFKGMPTVSWDAKGNKAIGMGVGPSVPLRVSGALKNNMSQIFMGWLNYMFTAAQLIQPAQTGLPFMQVAANRIGANPLSVSKSMAKGGTAFIQAFTESLGPKKIEGLDPVMREAFQYAKERGLFEFSEIEKAYQGTQGTLSRAKDRIAEANMKIGEQATRTPMFMAFVDLLVSNGMRKERAFQIAENMTQAAMIDYHQWERPMLYSGLGVPGSFMAGLTTFKHGLASQGVYLGKQVVKPSAGKRSEAVLPIAYATAAAVALGGITGMPFYSELDTLHRWITNHFGGEELTIRENVLKNLPSWAQNGVISAATNMNWQGKFSSADMVPDGTFRALSPHGEGAFKIAKGAVDMVTEQDLQSVRNFANAATPSGWKGIPESMLSRDENNYLIGKDGLPTYQRTDEEWETRKWTGMRSQREAEQRESVWDARMKERADTERRKSISQEYKRRIINNNMDPDAQAKLEKEYLDRKGDPRELLQLWTEVAKQKSMGEKERLQGTPNNLRGYNRWEYYNR